MKRKDPPEASSTGDTKRARPSTPADDELEDDGQTDLPSDGSKLDGDSAAARRRHARPLELDSEGEEEETSGKEEEEESLSEREEEPDETEVSERLSSGKVSCPSSHGNGGEIEDLIDRYRYRGTATDGYKQTGGV